VGGLAVDERWARPLPAHVWLKDDAGTFAVIPASQWPGGEDPADHDMARVMARCEGIAAAAVSSEGVEALLE
jgi:hypothetical protein